MIVTDIKELKHAAEYLKSAAEQEQDWKLRGALINVSCVLEQAIEEHVEDDRHPHLSEHSQSSDLDGPGNS